MIALHPQYVVDEELRRQAVLLPIEEWKQVLAELEELYAIRAEDQSDIDAAEKARQETDSISLEKIKARLDMR